MVLVALKHGLEDNLTRLLRCERAKRHPAGRQLCRVKCAKVLELALVATREAWQRDVEPLDILRRVVCFDFDDQGIVTFGAASHRHTLQLHAFALNTLDELHERRCSHDRDGLRHVGSEVHPAQPPPERLLRQDVAGRGKSTQADDGGDVANVPAFLQHQHRDDGLVRALWSINLVSQAAKFLKLLFVLSARGFGDLAVLLGVDHQDAARQLWTSALQISAYLVAIAGVVDHYEKHRLLPEHQMLGIALLPFLNAERQVVCEALMKDRTLLWMKALPACRVRQYRVLDDTLMDGLHQGIVAHSLYEDCAVIAAWRSCYIDLKRKPTILLEHPVMDIADASEPSHSLVVDVVRFVVENGELVDLADQLSQVDLAVCRSAARAWAKGLEKVVAQVVVVRGGLCDVPEIDPMDVGKEEVARRPHKPDVVLEV